MKKTFVFIPLLAFMLGACSVPFIGGNKEAEQAVQKEPEEKVIARDFLQNCKFDQDMCSYYATMIEAYNQPLTVVSTSSASEKDAVNFSSTLKVDGKGNMEITSTLGENEDSATVVLNNITYSKDVVTKSWNKIENIQETIPNDASMYNPIAVMNEFRQKAKAAEAFVVKKLGEEACGSSAPQLTCLKYQISEPDVNTQSIVWFDATEHKARRTETMYESMTVFSEYSYDAVVISEPSPIKEATTMSQTTEEIPGEVESVEAVGK